MLVLRSRRGVVGGSRLSRLLAGRRVITRVLQRCQARVVDSLVPQSCCQLLPSPLLLPSSPIFSTFHV